MQDPWKKKPWSHLVKWPESFLYETTDAWKLKLWPCVFLLEPAQEHALPVVIWIKDRVAYPKGDFCQALVRGEVHYSLGPSTTEEIPVQAISSYLDYRFCSLMWLRQPLPSLSKDRAKRYIELLRSIEAVGGASLPRREPEVETTATFNNHGQGLLF